MKKQLKQESDIERKINDYVKDIFEGRDESSPIGNLTWGLHLYNFLYNFSIQHNLKAEDIEKGIDKINYAIEDYNMLRTKEYMN